jgi:CxxC-x17-CxxC domain-containing protein
MSFVDKTLECRDCGASFIFGAGEQEFFASKGFENEPKRCPTCREARRQSNYGGDGQGGFRQRTMHPAVCATCGVDTEVPFEPRDGRPVYCSSCFSKERERV